MRSKYLACAHLNEIALYSLLFSSTTTCSCTFAINPMYRFLSIISIFIFLWPGLDRGMLAMDMDGDHAKGLKPRRKIAKLGKKFLRSGHIKASVTCSNLLACTKRHIGRHFCCRNFNFAGHPNGKKFPPKDVPKGFVAVYVGDEQEEQMRCVIPVLYFNHPLFHNLLQEAEQAYGFHQKGVFRIPCQIFDLEYLQWLIDRDRQRHQ